MNETWAERDRGTYGDGTASYPGDPGREHEHPSASVDTAGANEITKERK